MKNFKFLGLIAVVVMLIAAVSAFAVPADSAVMHFVQDLGLVSSGSTMLGMCVSFASIKNKCGANPGGTSELYIINKVDVDETQWPELGADGVTYAGPIVPKAGKGFAKWDFAQDTGDFGFTLSGDPGSQSFEHTVGVYIPRFNPEISKVYKDLPNAEIIAVKIDANGQKIVFGDLQRPLTPKLDYKSGKKFNEKNGAEFGLTVGNNHPPYFYSGDIPVVDVVAPAV
ncbi:hypothetical protein [Pontibacter mangrovi]|uniref:Uncharacterized protein n=1 Tax=Pontibacter mangrovi TaxID=2589816 RepID=A0A501W3V6_9BACT|nr:hypothetical protein [Pontibacter mangrovi]TPE43968.1 hypothetical protein FJM65_11120 [Pontibacter mangrovi]